MDHRLIPSKFSAVTPSDSNPLAPNIGLYVGGAGNVIAQGSDGVSATFACVAGTTLSGNFTRVMAASTATNIVLLGV